MGFVSVPPTNLGSNIDVDETFNSFKNDQLLLSTYDGKQGKSKTPKRSHSSLSPPPPPTHLSSQGKSKTLKRRGGKSKKRGGKTKKRNQKK